MTSQQYTEADAAINDLVNSARPSQQGIVVIKLILCTHQYIIHMM